MGHRVVGLGVAAIAVTMAACSGGSSEDAEGAKDGATRDARQDASTTCEVDSDCDDERFCNGDERCAPDDPDADRRGCLPAADPDPCLDSQTCSEEEGRCLSDCDTAPDADGDGHDAIDCGGDDCDDADPDRFPGNTEVCDEDHHDEDCDPSTFGERDGDEDGFADAACCNEAGDGTMMCGTDCDDGNPAVHPTADETCDGADNDCDGMVDEGVTVMLWPDADGDMFGDGSVVPMEGCPGTEGFVTNDGDCDDSRPAINPAASEVCDAMDVDEDCDPSTIGSRDADEDGFVSKACCNPQPDGSLLCGDDCDDGDGTIHPDATEICDGLEGGEGNDVDEDCDPSTLGPDKDGDGFVSDACCNPQPDGSTSCGEDCDDGDADGKPLCDHVLAADPEDTYPGAPELCDGCDNDCSDGGGRDTAEDGDGDNYLKEGYDGCSDGDLLRGDCHDGNADVHPNQRGYFGEGYCPRGTCGRCSGGGCYEPDDLGCVAACIGEGEIAESFDYDCDGEETKQPASTGCQLFCPSGFACGGGGPIHGASDECGDTVTHRACGSCDDGCPETTATAPLRCR